jgi:hypothetical protein
LLVLLAATKIAYGNHHTIPLICHWHIINIPFIPLIMDIPLPSSKMTRSITSQAWHGRGALRPACGPRNAVSRHRGVGFRCLRAVDEGPKSRRVTGDGESQRKMVI